MQNLIVMQSKAKHLSVMQNHFVMLSLPACPPLEDPTGHIELSLP
jgi:hypothetical protein